MPIVMMKLLFFLIVMILATFGLSSAADTNGALATTLFRLTSTVPNKVAIPTDLSITASATQNFQGPERPGYPFSYAGRCSTVTDTAAALGQKVTCPASGDGPTRLPDPHTNPAGLDWPGRAIAIETASKNEVSPPLDVTSVLSGPPSICLAANRSVCKIYSPGQDINITVDSAAIGGIKLFGFSLGRRGPGAGDRRALVGSVSKPSSSILTTALPGTEREMSNDSPQDHEAGHRRHMRFHAKQQRAATKNANEDGLPLTANGDTTTMPSDGLISARQAASPPSQPGPPGASTSSSKPNPCGTAQACIVSSSQPVNSSLANSFNNDAEGEQQSDRKLQPLWIGIGVVLPLLFLIWMGVCWYVVVHKGEDPLETIEKARRGEDEGMEMGGIRQDRVGLEELP